MKKRILSIIVCTFLFVFGITAIAFAVEPVQNISTENQQISGTLENLGLTEENISLTEESTGLTEVSISLMGESSGLTEESLGLTEENLGLTESDNTKSIISNELPIIHVDELPFVDVDADSWYAAPVAFVYHKNLMVGMDASHFGPTITLSRGQFATILYRYENEPAITFDPTMFPDVTNEKDFFAVPAVWAGQMGYIKGYESGLFGPADIITREQLAVILFRFSEAKGYDVTAKGDLSKFPDADKISSWAKDPVVWANGVGIILGKENTTDGTRFIDPQGKASRAECAAMLQRFIAYAEGQK